MNEPPSRSVIDARIDSIRRELAALVERLRSSGFRFHHPERVLPGVEPDVEASIARIEREIGPVPYAVAAFWRKIGSVDVTGKHANGTYEYLDPLVVEPASSAVAELIDFLGDRQARLLADFPYCIPIAPDRFHKEDVSGGIWYNVDCPATSDNPVVNEEPHGLHFLEYLELALSRVGFPGL